jgi:uncharacterized sulfatase
MKSVLNVLWGLFFLMHLSGAAELQKPNILLFIADDQSVFDYGSYGNGAVLTGVTDRFAGQSLVFDRAFTGQAICAPSR